MFSWRNWLARSAVNRKVGGSSPPGGVCFSLLGIKVILYNQDKVRDTKKTLEKEENNRTRNDRLPGGETTEWHRRGG